MSDDYSAPITDFGIDSQTTPITARHQNLLNESRLRWHDSQQALQRLVSEAPGIRQMIGQSIRQHWALDGERAGLLFDDGHRMSLTQACALVAQRPTIAGDLDATSAPFGLPAGHTLHGLPPTELLEALKALRLDSHLMDLWMGYWHTRAPETSRTRYDHAQEQYKAHFRATCEWSLAEGTLSAPQLRTLLSLLDARADDTPARAQSLALAIAASRQPRLAGALLIARDPQASHEHFLYLPAHSPVIQVFASQAQAQTWLLHRMHHFWPDLGNAVQPGYSIACTALDSLDNAFQHMMEHLRTRMFQATLSGTQTPDAATDLQPLAAADRFDDWRRTGALLTPAPPAAAQASLDASPTTEQESFDSLHDDTPLDTRLGGIKRQRAAFEAALGEAVPPVTSQVQPLLDALQAASDKARDAASRLLAHEPLYELRTQDQTQQTALLQARLTALRTELAIQRLLNQLDEDDQAVLEAVLDAPQASTRSDTVIAASVTLRQTDTDNQANEQGLSGAVVFCHAARPREIDPGRPVLFYLPGSGGGLLRFASAAAMQEGVFKTGEMDENRHVLLTPLEGDPFFYGLQHQLADCERTALDLHRQHPHANGQAERQQALEALRQQTLLSLQVPPSSVRELAWSQILEQQQTLSQFGSLPEWLQRLSGDERLHLKGLVTAYMKAARQSQALMERDLPARELFAERQVSNHLASYFGLQGPVRVDIDLPDTYTHQREVIAGSGAPGTPSKLVVVPSAQRSRMALSSLALANVDEAMRTRIHFMQPVISGGEPADQDKLKSMLNAVSLRQFVTDLDLAGRYEKQIGEAFLGKTGESAFDLALREERLFEPFRLMLQIQGMAARQRFLNDAGETILRIAIDARSAEAFRADGHDIRLLPVDLTAGGPDTDDRSTTLSGVTFIHDSNSGTTLTYLPESPDGHFLRQYDSLEQARMALYRLAFSEPMANWMANRALVGDPAAHLSRINAACVAHHDRIIGIGHGWPASTSLAAHLCNAHMGRLIQAHRLSAVSNRDLRLEQAALKSGMLFNYIKMALGVVPFVGAAIALYDAWVGANEAAAAILRGTPGQGLEHLETVLLCLIDATMDLLPGLGLNPVSAHQLTRQRQLRTLGSRLPVPGIGQPRRTALDRFQGYECHDHIALDGLRPAAQGIYRNIYRHPEGDLILNHGQLYRVEFDEARHTWRLVGKGRSAYRQPIALDAAGNWDTHGALYGVNILGPVAGGGNALGLLADAVDPLWPAALRQRLPEWWTNRALRRQQALRSGVEKQQAILAEFNARTNEIQNGFNGLTDEARRRPLWSELTVRYARERELAHKLYTDAQELTQLSSGNNRTRLKDLQSRLAWLQVDRLCNELHHTKVLALDQLEKIDELIAQTASTPATEVRRHMTLMQERKQNRIRLLEQLDAVVRFKDDIELWQKRITAQGQRSQTRERVQLALGNFAPGTQDVVRATQYLEIINRYEAATDLPWFYLQKQLVRGRTSVDRAMNNHSHLPEVQANPVQRRQILEASIETYQQYRRDLMAWNASYPEYLDQAYVQPLLDTLERLSVLAEQWKQKLPAEAPTLRRDKRPTRDARQTRKIFETEDNQLVTGFEDDSGTVRRRISVNSVSEVTEVYVPGENGRWRLQSEAETIPQPPAVDPRRVIEEAQGRLNKVAGYLDKVQGYARQNMLPVDLEHLLVSEANELRLRAERIIEIEPQSTLVARLRDKASELAESGRQLRIRQTLASETPGAGMLDYLLEQDAVEVIRLGRPSELPKRPDGRGDFLQEYEIRDITQGTPVPLWYAHFHYTSASPVFDSFVKAHLKTAAQRRLGLQWQQTQGDNAERIWRGDIGKPLGRKHFQALFES